MFGDQRCESESAGDAQYGGGGGISFFLTTSRVFFSVNRSTVLGAAILAGGALGLFNWDLTKPETLAKVNRLDVKVFSPTIDEQEREWKYSGWTRAVDRARGWKSEHPPPPPSLSRTPVVRLAC